VTTIFLRFVHIGKLPISRIIVNVSSLILRYLVEQANARIKNTFEWFR
jgi:hypothetical protein